MEILSTNCAGLDVHKQTVKVCLLTRTSDGQFHKEFRTYLTTTQELLQLGDWLKAHGCTHVAFEATGVYWKPVFNEARKAVLNCSAGGQCSPYQSWTGA
jgi:transposase